MSLTRLWPWAWQAASATEGTRAVVMCAYSDTTLRLALTQAKVLRDLFGVTERVTIFHADELTLNNTMLRHVGSVPGVEVRAHSQSMTCVHNTTSGYHREAFPKPKQVRNLAGWYNRTYPDLPPRALGVLKGFLCKPAAVLAVEAEVVALMDLDVVLFESPFALTATETFRSTGSYLFRDSRAVYGWKVEPLRAAVRELWRRLMPEQPQLPATMRESPWMTGQSIPVGESAVVLYDKGNARLLPFHAKPNRPSLTSRRSC
jgi:hypothetical protein